MEVCPPAGSCEVRLDPLPGPGRAGGFGSAAGREINWCNERQGRRFGRDESWGTRLAGAPPEAMTAASPVDERGPPDKGATDATTESDVDAGAEGVAGAGATGGGGRGSGGGPNNRGGGARNPGGGERPARDGNGGHEPSPAQATRYAASATRPAPASPRSSAWPRRDSPAPAAGRGGEPLELVIVLVLHQTADDQGG